MSIEQLGAVAIPLANHAPDGLGFALLLYFGPVLALVAFLVFIARRGGSAEGADGETERPAEDDDGSAEGLRADDPSA